MFTGNTRGTVMKPTNFAQYMSTYLTVFLPGVKGVSYNTIQTQFPVEIEAWGKIDSFPHRHGV